MLPHDILLKVGKVLDDAFASFLHQHVVGGYEWLVEHYKPGDKIYFFGKSSPHYYDAISNLVFKLL